MAHHQDSTSKHTSAKKRPSGLQWGLDQELAEKSQLTHPLSPIPLYPRGGGSGGGGSGDLSISTTTEELQREMCSWLIKHDISSINWFLATYSIDRLRGAIEDFERATTPDSHGRYFTPNNPTRFFRSLLIPPPEQKNPVQYQNTPVDKYQGQKYDDLVQRFNDHGGEHNEDE